MGKKKGGAKNKLARMSEEERARYLQHRADIEEEAKRRKQQLVALYMKNKLKREEAFSRLNLAKINQEWRSILRQIKCQELKNEIVAVAAMFQDALEQKNRIIRRLLSDLDEAEEMYSNLSQSHMESVDKLIDIQNQRMEYFKKSYITQKGIILQECKDDFEMYKTSRRRLQVELECVYFATEDLRQKQFRETNENHLSRMDDLKSSMTIKLEEITQTREKQLELLWTEYQQILNDYVKYTEEFYSEYTELREHDEQNTKLIRSHCIEVARVTDQMTDLKIIADNVTEESEFQIQYLEKYRRDLYDKYLMMKKDFENQQNLDNEQFQLMVVSAHQILKALENFGKKGEILLQLAGICHRHETEREQIIPFGHRREAFNKTVDDSKKPPPTETETETTNTKHETLQNWLNMEQFWSRVNKVRLDVACLQQEKTFLQYENQDLKAQLKEYMTNVVIASGPNGSIEDRLLNRPASMKIEKVMHIDLQDIKPATSDGNFGRTINKKSSILNRHHQTRPLTCVEANLSNAVRSVKLTENKLNTIKLKTIVNW